MVYNQQNTTSRLKYPRTGANPKKHFELNTIRFIPAVNRFNAPSEAFVHAIVWASREGSHPSDTEEGRPIPHKMNPVLGGSNEVYLQPPNLLRGSRKTL